MYVNFFIFQIIRNLLDQIIVDVSETMFYVYSLHKLYAIFQLHFKCFPNRFQVDVTIINNQS